jgi:hypothetical protein
MGLERKLRRNPRSRLVAPGKLSVEGDDRMMLSTAKQWVQSNEHASKLIEHSVIVVCDIRDRIGAQIAASSLRLSLDQLRDIVMVGPEPGEPNPMPFIAVAVPRHGLCEMMTRLGFGVPPEWTSTLAQPPHEPNWYVVLKRDGRGLLLEIDLAQVPGLGVGVLLTPPK